MCRRTHLDKHGPAAVPEQDARAPVPPVDVAGQRVGPDDENVLHRAPSNIVHGADNAQNEAAAGGGEVERGGI